MKILLVALLTVFISCGKNNTTPKDDNGFGPRGGEREVGNPNEALTHLKFILNDSVMNVDSMTLNDEVQELEECVTDNQIHINRDGSFENIENTPCDEEQADTSGTMDLYIQSGDIIIAMKQEDGSVVEFTLVSYGYERLTLRTIQYISGFEYKIDIKYAISRPE